MIIFINLLKLMWKISEYNQICTKIVNNILTYKICAFCKFEYKASIRIWTHDLFIFLIIWEVQETKNFRCN